MAENDFNENVNSNEGGSFDLNSFSTVGAQKNADVEHAPAKTAVSRKKKITTTILTVFLIGIITVSLVVATFAVYVFGFIDDSLPEDLDNLVLNFTTTIYVQDKKTGEYTEYKRIHGGENRIWVDFNDMPKHLGDAFIAIEDERFNDHDGVDWKRTVYAFANEFLNFSSKFGGSTITQQLVKNLTMDTDQNAMRKVREIMRARRLEMEYHKDTILECYLNVINLGGGRCGVEVASNYYFGKSAKDLTISESAVLASIVKSPEYYRPDKNPKNNRQRQLLVLDKMLELKLITKEEYKEAVDEEVNIVANAQTASNQEIYSYFVDALIEQVANDLSELYDIDKTHASTNVYNGGYKIYCTLDPKVQSAVESVFYNESVRTKNSKTGELGQGSITVMDYEGHVVGIAGGLGEKKENRGLNRATSSPRQPGSTMKPIAAYAPAIEKNLITYSSLVNDTRKNYNNNTWSPKNWYGGYWGNITAAYALQRSVNTIPVMLVNEMTPKNSYTFLTEKLGMKHLNNPQDIDLAPMGLGGTNGGVTTLESAAAYAIFGNGGYYYEPSFYTKITDQHGEVILEKKTNPVAAIGEDTATIMNHMLQNVVYGDGGTGAGAAGYVPHMKIFAKTGTSSETNDIWFVGGTPHYVASCWYGYDNNGVISQSGLARKLWGQVMSKVHSGIASAKFNDSKYVERRYYCTETGLLATKNCTTTGVGWYKKTDKKTCTTHKGSIRDIVVDAPVSSASSTSSGAANTSSAAPTTSTAQTSSAAATSSQATN